MEATLNRVVHFDLNSGQNFAMGTFDYFTTALFNSLTRDYTSVTRKLLLAYPWFTHS